MATVTSSGRTVLGREWPKLTPQELRRIRATSKAEHMKAPDRISSVAEKRRLQKEPRTPPNGEEGVNAGERADAPGADPCPSGEG